MLWVGEGCVYDYISAVSPYNLYSFSSEAQIFNRMNKKKHYGSFTKWECKH